MLQAQALNKAPKYGRDDDAADALAAKVMELWAGETWKHRTRSTSRRFRPGMLSWNYWVGDGYILAASADGRPRGKFLSNAICPSNGADINGPTANANSVGKALGGKAPDGQGDWQDYFNCCPTAPATPSPSAPPCCATPSTRKSSKPSCGAMRRTAAPPCRSTW